MGEPLIETQSEVTPVGKRFRDDLKKIIIEQQNKQGG